MPSLINKTYSGIGSRQTPPEILKHMNELARSLYRAGYTLRSGGAPGADQSFEWGAVNEAQKNINDSGWPFLEVYLPWKSFEEGARSMIPARLDEPQKEAYAIAEEFHPRWKYLKFGAKKLQARNVHQIYGPDVTNPVFSDFVICWTPKARGSGGTGQAIRIARSLDIPIYDLADEDQQKGLWIHLNGSFII